MNDVFIDSPQYDILVEKDGSVYKRSEYIHNYQRGTNKPISVGYITDNRNNTYTYVSKRAGGPTAILYPNGSMEPIQQQSYGGFNNYNEIPSAGFNNVAVKSGVVGDVINNGSVSIGGSTPAPKPVEPKREEGRPGIPNTILSMMDALPVHFALQESGIIQVREFDGSILASLLYKMFPSEENAITPIITSYSDLYIKYVINNDRIYYKMFNDIKKDGKVEIERHRAIYDDLAKSALDNRKLSVVDGNEGTLNLNDGLLDVALEVLTDRNELTVVSLMNTAGYYTKHNPIGTDVKSSEGTVYVEDKNNLIVNTLYRDVLRGSNTLNELLDNMEYLNPSELASINKYVANIVKETISTINPSILLVDVEKFNAVTDTKAIIASMHSSINGEDSGLAALGRLMKLGLDRLYVRLMQSKEFDIIGSYLDSVRDSEIFAGGLTEYYMGIAVRDPKLLLELEEISKTSSTDIFEVTDMTPVLKNIASNVFEGLITKVDNSNFDILTYGDMRYVFILITKGNKYKVVKSVNNKIVIYKI